MTRGGNKYPTLPPPCTKRIGIPHQLLGAPVRMDDPEAWLEGGKDAQLCQMLVGTHNRGRDLTRAEPHRRGRARGQFFRAGTGAEECRIALIQ